MRRGGWTSRSALWFVFLVALGLKAATGTWGNLKRASIDYHRYLSARCEVWSTLDLRMAKQVEDDSTSKSLSDPATAAELRQWAMSIANSSRSYSLLAASLAEKAELCERSAVGWIFLQYQTSQNPPDLPVQHVSHAPRHWLAGTPLPALFQHPIMVAISRVDYFGLGCFVLAIVARMKFARAWGGRMLGRLQRKS